MTPLQNDVIRESLEALSVANEPIGPNYFGGYFADGYTVALRAHEPSDTGTAYTVHLDHPEASRCAVEHVEAVVHSNTSNDDAINYFVNHIERVVRKMTGVVKATFAPA